MRPLPAPYAGYARLAAPSPGAEVIAGGCGFTRLSLLRRTGAALSRAAIQRAHGLAALDHPGLARLHDIGEDEQGGFLLREYVVGRSLAAPAGPLPPRLAAAALDQLARALAELHQAGLVHGALRPGNVILGADGQVVLTDLAPALAPSDAPARDLADLAALARALGCPPPRPGASTPCAPDPALAAWVAAAGGDPLGPALRGGP